MILKILIIGLINLFGAADTSTIVKFPSNRKIPDRKKQPEHFALLQNDPVGSLPDKFSFCSSVFVGYFRDAQIFMAVLKDDDTMWFNLNFEISTYSLWLDREDGAVLLD